MFFVSHSNAMRNLLIIFSLLLCTQALGKSLWVTLDKLAPTQMNIGVYAMKDKVAKIERKNREGKLLKYLNKKYAPSFLGPDRRYYIIDRHHTSRALYEANVPVKKFKVEVIKDLSHLDWPEFYDFMEKGHYLYLYDQGVGPTQPEDLPKHIWELSDDPYRSLAWMVRESGGFEKVDVPYLEFMWGDFFRKRIQLAGTHPRDLYDVLNEAYDLSQSEEASFLPGYNSCELMSKGCYQN